MIMDQTRLLGHFVFVGPDLRAAGQAEDTEDDRRGPRQVLDGDGYFIDDTRESAVFTDPGIYDIYCEK